MEHNGETYTVRLGVKGRLVLPKAVRRALGIEEGDRLLLVVREGKVELLSAREAVRRAQGMFAHLAPGRSLAEELIQARREEG